MTTWRITIFSLLLVSPDWHLHSNHPPYNVYVSQQPESIDVSLWWGLLLLDMLLLLLYPVPMPYFYIWPLYLLLDISTIFATLQKSNPPPPCIPFQRMARDGKFNLSVYRKEGFMLPLVMSQAKPIHSTQGLSVGPITTAQSEENCEKKLSCRQWW